jgi:hypothetical protein
MKIIETFYINRNAAIDFAPIVYVVECDGTKYMIVSGNKAVAVYEMHPKEESK